MSFQSLEQALEIASRVTHPVAAAAVALVVAGFCFYCALRAKKTGITWVLGILAVGVIILGLAPLAASTYVASRGVYRVRVIVLGAGGSPIEDADVTSSIGGEVKRVQGGLEFDIPLQTQRADGKVTLFASEKSAFLTGSSTIILAQDYYPTTTIQLASDTSATIHGVVLDEHGGSVVGATVSIPGNGETVVTDKMGNFTLPAHAADGQIVEVRAQKDKLAGSMSGPAGHSPLEIIVKQR
jgi:hypothetical protein